MLQTYTPVSVQLSGLRQSFGVHVSPSIQAKAQALAPKVKAIRPNVWFVGKSFVSQWSGLCSCKRSRCDREICEHQIAVYLSEQLHVWRALTADARKYWQLANVDEPEIIAEYATAVFGKSETCPGVRLRVRVINIQGGIADVETIGYHPLVSAWSLPYTELTHFTPFYE